MKINEINQSKQLDESLAGKMFGDVPMAAIKGLFTGKGTKHQLAQDIFIRDFYQDAITSLDNGIKSGYVDKKKPYAPSTQSGTASGTNPPPSGTNPPPSGSPAPTDAIERGRQARADDTAAWDKRKEERLKALGLKIGDTVTVKVDGKTVTGTVDGVGMYDDEFSFTPSGRFARFMGDNYSRDANVDDIISKSSATSPGTPTSSPTATSAGTPTAGPGTPTSSPTATSTGTPAASPNTSEKPKKFTIQTDEPAQFTGSQPEEPARFTGSQPTRPAAAAAPTTRPAAPTTRQPNPAAKGYSFKTTQSGAPAQAQRTVNVPPQNVKFNTPGTNQQDPNNKRLDWAPPGMNITGNTKMSSVGATGKLAESTYHNLNNIFESVISEMEGGDDTTTTITDHMLEWFGLYMSGVNWESKKAAIIPLIKKVQDTYGTDGGKAAIKNLAKFAYSISGKGGTVPAGAKNAMPNTSSSQTANQLTPDQITQLVVSQPKAVQDKIIQQVQQTKAIR